MLLTMYSMTRTPKGFYELDVKTIDQKIIGKYMIYKGKKIDRY